MSDLTRLSDEELLRQLGGPAAAPAQPSGAAVMSDEQLLAALKAPQAPKAEPSTLARVGSGAADLAQAAGAGLIRGAAGLIDLPQNLYGLAESGADWAARKTISAFGGKPSEDRTVDPRLRGLLPSPADLPKLGERGVNALEAATGKLYEPQSTAGQYARTVAEFIPGAGSGSARLLKLAVAPAIASEAAGQATKGSDLEPWARGAAGLGTSAIGGMIGGAGYYERMAAHAAHGTTPEQFAQAEQLARNAPFPIMASEAIQSATGGGTQMGRVQRLAESTEGGARVLDPIMARRPEQMATATEAGLNAIGPRNPRPTELGPEVQQAARGAVMTSPQGQALDAALAASGPRTTAGMAGDVIQPDLRGTRDLREAARSSRANVDYRAARESPENVGVERQITVERPGDPVVTQPQYSRPQFHDGAPRPLDPPPTVEAEAGAGPMSLGRFVARNGGLPLEGDVLATDLHRFNIPGNGNVARSGGKSIDNFWRERLIEEGYFRPDADGGMARDISSELLRKLQNEQRGYPSYPVGQERAAAAERMKPGQVQDDYRAALSQAESRLDTDLRRVDVDPAGIHPDVRSRVLGAMMRGEEADPLIAYERTVGALREPPAPYSRSTTVEEQIPDIRFGQVNPQPAIDAIDSLQRTAKGDVSSALSGVRRNLHGPDGQTDLTVAGNLRTRERLDQDIAAAQAIGDATKVRDLTIARHAIDAELKRVPEVATADANFARNSIPLQPFGGQSPLGRVTARDDLTGRMQMPAEQVPGALSQPSAQREFRGMAGPQARGSFDDYLTTHMLDGAPDAFRVDAGRLRTGMRDQADLLNEATPVRDRLSRVLAAREDLEPVVASPVGQMAGREDVRGQLAQLLARDASPLETRETVRALAGQNDAAARGLVREGASQMVDRTVRRPDSLGRPDQYGGAKFARDFRGPGEGANLRAAIEAAIGERSQSLNPLLDSLAATGWRDRIGSRTSFNTEDLKNLKQGGRVGEAVKFATRPMHTVHDGIEKALLGRSSEKLAELLASGATGVRRIQELQSSNNRAALIAALMASRVQPEPALPRR